MYYLILYFFLFGGAIFSSCQDGPIVNTPLGSILGTIQTSRNGNDFYSFRGIRYAEAPVGDLRFKPPVPAPAWDGILDATQDGPACYQANLTYLSEDCLNLYVYTRRINNVDDCRPVLVYIHGGGFTFWAAQSYVHGPDYMMDYDIVLVVINYRLGTLGFFSTGDSNAPGNYGMKDQVLALKWVQDNIKYFGGDANRVTLAGQSAGAASIGYHLISPMSKGLFHGGIMMSGAPISGFFYDKNPIDLARRQAELLNCPTTNSADMVECMRRIPPEDIIDMYPGLLEWNAYGRRYNTPTVEPENSDGERFLEKDPLELFVEGKFKSVPIFIGTTRDEYIQDGIRVFKDQTAVADLSENFDEIAPKIFQYDQCYPQNETISDTLREFYLPTLNNSTSSDDAIKGLGNLFSDSLIMFPTVRNAKLIAKKSKKPVYLYQFNYLGEGLQACFGEERPNTVGHRDDLHYEFYSERICPVKFNLTGPDGRFVTQYTTLWYNFITTGNPTPEASQELDNVIWEPYNDANPKYLDINQDLSLKKGLYYNERISLWENLFPINPVNNNGVVRKFLDKKGSSHVWGGQKVSTGEIKSSSSYVYSS